MNPALESHLFINTNVFFQSMPVQSNLSKGKENCEKNVAASKLELKGLELPHSPDQSLHFELPWHKNSVKIVNC